MGGDLLLGKADRSAIGSVVERRRRYVLLLHLPHGRTAEREGRVILLSIQLSIDSDIIRHPEVPNGRSRGPSTI